ncbi:hypothetical protein ABGB12_04690 [Actinocorallia sp. B10E7]
MGGTAGSRIYPPVEGAFLYRGSTRVTHILSAILLIMGDELDERR